MKAGYEVKVDVEDDLQIFGIGYSIDMATFIKLINKGKGQILCLMMMNLV